jgi:hypothetical protein
MAYSEIFSWVRRKGAIRLGASKDTPEETIMNKTGMTLAIFLVVAKLLIGPAEANGTAYYESAANEVVGTRIEDAGLILGGDWAIDARVQSLEWTITWLDTGLWLYEYTLANFFAPEVGHVILDLSSGCVPGNPGCVIGVPELLEFKTFGSAKSNPGFPNGASITGVKFDGTDESLSMVSFTSTHAPVYGDFYVKGGHDSFAYNAGLANHGSADRKDFIARPGTVTVPEPAVPLLLGCGLFCLAVAHRRIT